MAKEKDLIKVRYKGSQCGENMWAKPLTQNTAQLKNIPFHAEIGLNDVVEIDSDRNITKVLKRKSITCGIKYKFTKAGIQEEYKKLALYFEKKNKIPIEGAVIGMASLAVPMKMTKKSFVKIVEKSPIKIINYYSSELV